MNKKAYNKRKKPDAFCIGYFKSMKQYFFRNFLILLLLTFSFFSARAIHAFADHYTSDDKSITIVIDPGHGGPDPGKISPSGILEKDINLQISSTLKTLLKNRWL